MSRQIEIRHPSGVWVEWGVPGEPPAHGSLSCGKRGFVSVPPPGVRPDHYASYTKKLQNQLKHNGIHVTLNTSDETLETLKTAIGKYEELIDRSLELADVSSAAKFAGVLEKVGHE